MTFPFSAAYPNRNIRHILQHRVHVRHHVLAIDEDRAGFRRAQRDMQDRSPFCDVDLFPTEHCVDPLSQIGFYCQLNEQFESLVCQAILRIIEE